MAPSLQWSRVESLERAWGIRWEPSSVDVTLILFEKWPVWMPLTIRFILWHWRTAGVEIWSILISHVIGNVPVLTAFGRWSPWELRLLLSCTGVAISIRTTWLARRYQCRQAISSHVRQSVQGELGSAVHQHQATTFVALYYTALCVMRMQSALCQGDTSLRFNFRR